jgi:hypothetical protein
MRTTHLLQKTCLHPASNLLTINQYTCRYFCDDEHYHEVIIGLQGSTALLRWSIYRLLYAKGLSRKVRRMWLKESGAPLWRWKRAADISLSKYSFNTQYEF